MIAFICIEKLNAPYRPFNYLIIIGLLICRENHYALLFALSFVYFLFSAKNQKKKSLPTARVEEKPSKKPPNRQAITLHLSVQFYTLLDSSVVPLCDSLLALLAHKVAAILLIVEEE